MKTSLLSHAVILAVFATAAFPAQAQTVDDLQIQQRSIFTMAAARNPFLPVGWKKPEPVNTGAVSEAPKEVSDAFFKPESFVVTSISIGAVPLALINGRAYEEGELIPMGEGINVQVVAIRDGKVTLRYKNKTIESLIQTNAATPGKPTRPGKRR